MKKRLLSFLLPLFLPALFWGFPSLYSLEEGPQQDRPNSGNTLNRLIEISNQLSELNGKLRNELQDSRRNSRELQSMLEASKTELDILRQELSELRSSSAELLNKAETSQTELTGLRTALKRAESSLMSLELSFAAYREAAERKILNLEKKNRFWKYLCAASGLLSCGLGAALISGH